MKRVVLTVIALLAFHAADVPAAEPLGRLFFTPAQRNTLDAGKQLDLPKKAGPTVRGPRSVTVNGVVTRSDGESTVWVNGAPAESRRPGAAPISAKPAGPAGARVRVLDSESKLRVGQTLDRRTGKVTEAYEHKPAPPEPSAAPREASGAQPPGHADAQPKDKAAED